MRERKIVVEPFDTLDLLECTIHKTVNKHATVKFSGHISEELEDEYVEMNLKDTWGRVTVYDDDGNEQSLFQGIVKQLEIQTVNGVKTLSGELISGTYLMDTIENTRTFQDKNMPYRDVMNFYLSQYPQNGMIMTVGNGTPIGDWFLQYEETDWEFTRRLASQFNSFLVPETKTRGVKYFFGMPKRGEPVRINTAHYSMKKCVDEYVCKMDRRVNGLRERDAIYYTIEEREIFDIGDVIILNGRMLYVYEINSRLTDTAELVHTYYLKSEEGFKFPVEYNRKMIGASLASNIIDVTRDVVKVHVQADPGQDVGTAKWFPYSTVYSTPDGTGWYVMPEIGDEMRLYIPSGNEREGYVISAVHLESSDSSERAVPDNKSLMNKYRKEVLFTPDSLVFTNNKGMTIQILDGFGIKIESNKNIDISASNNVCISSTGSTIEVNAPSCVSMTQGGTNLTLQGDIKFSGGQVKIQ